MSFHLVEDIDRTALNGNFIIVFVIVYYNNNITYCNSDVTVVLASYY